jgi:hypothetical protein
MIDRNPNIKIERIATRYPSKLVLYSTIEKDTASQNGHLTLVDLYFLPNQIDILLFKKVEVILLIMILEEVCSRADFRVGDYWCIL